jgi:hypothetical protein
MNGNEEIVNIKSIYVNDEPLVAAHQEEPVAEAETEIVPAPVAVVAVAVALVALLGLGAGLCQERSNCKYIFCDSFFFPGDGRLTLYTS